MIPSVLFVCLGNICRSPLAEAAMRLEAEKIGLEVVVDSAGTGDWHAGQPPDPRARAAALRNGVDISGYAARQVKPSDFRRFTHIVALDHDNLSNLRRLAPADGISRLGLLLDYAPDRAGQPVADPYWSDDAAFDITWADVSAGARGLAAALRRGD